MSKLAELKRRLDYQGRADDVGVQWAFEQWLKSNPGGTLREFYHRHKGRRTGKPHKGRGAQLRQALRRANDPSLPLQVRQRAQQEVSRLERVS